MTQSRGATQRSLDQTALRLLLTSGGYDTTICLDSDLPSFPCCCQVNDVCRLKHTVSFQTTTSIASLLQLSTMAGMIMPEGSLTKTVSTCLTHSPNEPSSPTHNGSTTNVPHPDTRKESIASTDSNSPTAQHLPQSEVLAKEAAPTSPTSPPVQPGNKDRRYSDEWGGLPSRMFPFTPTFRPEHCTPPASRVNTTVTN